MSEQETNVENSRERKLIVLGVVFIALIVAVLYVGQTGIWQPSTVTLTPTTSANYCFLIKQTTLTSNMGNWSVTVLPVVVTYVDHGGSGLMTYTSGTPNLYIYVTSPKFASITLTWNVNKGGSTGVGDDITFTYSGSLWQSVPVKVYLTNSPSLCGI